MGKVLRQMIKIDEEKCDGCGICIDACHEGALALIDGKAKVVKDDYCDGLGDCLPACPQGAISFEMREAAPYDKEAVEARMAETAKQKQTPDTLACGCPGTQSRTFERKSGEAGSQVEQAVGVGGAAGAVGTDEAAGAVGLGGLAGAGVDMTSKLNQWPVQIKLVPVNAPYFHNANLLIAADCTAFAYGNFHNDFMKNKITIVGCPKLDEGDYAEKLTEIIKENEIKSVTVVRMEVPCCGGLENAVKRALINSGKMIPWQIVTISSEGEILE